MKMFRKKKNNDFCKTPQLFQKSKNVEFTLYLLSLFSFHFCLWTNSIILQHQVFTFSTFHNFIWTDSILHNVYIYIYILYYYEWFQIFLNQYKFTYKCLWHVNSEIYSLYKLFQKLYFSLFWHSKYSHHCL